MTIALRGFENSQPPALDTLPVPFWGTPLMAFALVGFGLAFSFLFIQWYMGKKADDEERRLKEQRRHRTKRRRPGKR